MIIFYITNFLTKVPKYALPVVLTLALGLLAGCASFQNPNQHPNKAAQGLMAGAVAGGTIAAVASGGPLTPAGVAAGGALGGIIGSYLDKHQDMRDTLKSQGVQVIRVGDNVKLLLPVDKVFFQDSPELNPDYFSVLDMVATLIKRFQDKTTVEIATFCDNEGWAKRSQSLSTVRADHVAEYLWHKNTDSRLMVARGFGQDGAIASNKDKAGRAMNRRVEIKFRVLPKDYV